MKNSFMTGVAEVVLMPLMTGFFSALGMALAHYVISEFERSGNKRKIGFM